MRGAAYSRYMCIYGEYVRRKQICTLALIPLPPSSILLKEGLFIYCSHKEFIHNHLGLCFIPVNLVSCAKSLSASVHEIGVFRGTVEGSLIREEPVEGACGMLIRNSSDR